MAKGKRCWIDMEAELKECSVCGEVLPFSSFYKNKKNKHGLVGHCIECDRKRKGRTFIFKKCSIDYDKKLKECASCRQVLPFDKYTKSSSQRTGLSTICKDCVSIKNGTKKRRLKIDVENRVRECNRCERLLSFDEFYPAKNRKCGVSSICKECESERHKHPKVKKIRRAYYEKNKDKLKQYKLDNKEAFKKVQAAYVAKRKAVDPSYRLAKTLRSRLNVVIRGKSKVGSAVKDLGCSLGDLKQYLESKFYDRSDGQAMSWDNYGRKGWHVDHIKPLAIFDLTDRQQFLEACHYTNLQPLWAEDNLAKGDR